MASIDLTAPKVDAEAFATPNSYELKVPGANGYETRRVWLNPSRNTLQRLSQQDYASVQRRAMMIWRRIGQAKNISGEFIYDLAASMFDDSAMLQIAQMRQQMVEDSSWRARAASWAGKPFSAAMKGLDFVFSAPMRRVIRTMTGDKTADTGTWFALQVNGRYHEYEGSKTPMSDFAKTLTSPRDQVLRLAGEMILDPATLVFGGLQTMQAGRIVRAAGEVPVLGKGKLAASYWLRTSPEELPGLIEHGPMNLQQAFQTGRLAEYARARFGGIRKERIFLERVASARSEGHLQGILGNANGFYRAFIWDRLERARRAAHADRLQGASFREAEIEGALRGLTDVFDATKLDEWADDYARIQAKRELLIDELDSALALARPGPLTVVGENPNTGVRVGFPPGVRSQETIPDHLEALQILEDEVTLGLSAWGRAQDIPRRRLAQQFRDYADTHAIQFQAYDARASHMLVARAITGTANVAATTLERISMIRPHGSFRVDDPRWLEQHRRLYMERELATQNAKNPWTRDDTEAALSRLAKLPPQNLMDAVYDDAREAWRRLDVSDDELTSLMGEYERVFSERTYGTTTRGGQVKTPIRSSHLFNQQGLIDTELYRRVAKLKEKGKPLTRLDRQQLIDDVYSTWRLLAVARFAYLVRVTGFSEIPRNIVAGHLNPLVHLPAWIADSFPDSKIADLIQRRATAKRIGHEISEGEWDLPQDLMDLAAETARGVYLPGTLGTQVKPAEVRLSAAGWKSELGGLARWKDMVHPNQQHFYREGWLRLLNEQEFNDEIVRLFWMTDGSIDDAYEWLRGSQAGHAYARRLGLQPDKPGFDDRGIEFLRLHKEVHVNLTRSLPPEMKKRIGQLSMDDLADLAVPSSLPIAVFESTTRSPAMVMVAESVDHVFKWFFDLLSRGSEALARRGPYRAEVGREAARLVALAQETGSSASWRKIMAAFRGETAALSASEQTILRAAKDHAEHRVKQVVYDLAEAARWTDLAAFKRLFPFGNAWQEELTRWIMLTMDRPGTASVLASSAREAVETDLISQTDPTTGTKYFVVPGSGWLTQAATGKFNPMTRGLDGMRWPIRLPWENIFSLTAGGDIGPGFGPALQIPAHIIQRTLPSTRDEFSWLFPYFNPNLVQTVLPSPFLRQWVNATDDERSVRFARQLGNVIGWHEAREGPLTGADLEDAKRQVRALNTLEAFASLFVGGGPKVALPPKTQELVDFYRDVTSEVPEARDHVMLSAHGRSLALWMQSVTEAASGRTPPTKEAFDFLLNPRMRELAEDYSEAFWPAMSERLTGETFDSAFYTSLVNRGERRPFHVDDFYEAAMVKVAWARYSKVRRELDHFATTRGFTLDDPRGKPLREALTKYRSQVLESAYPGFAEDFAEWNERQAHRRETIREVAKLMREPETEGLESRAFADDYFEARRLIRGLMKQKDWKSLDSEQARPLNVVWQRMVEQLVAAHPKANDFYERVFSLDPMDFDL